MIDFLPLHSTRDVDILLDNEQQDAGLFAIYKHSPTCDLSFLAKRRLEKDWSFTSAELPIYFVDVISQRSISNYIAQRLGIRHESPQILMIKSGECIYDEDHMAINIPSINEAYIKATNA